MQDVQRNTEHPANTAEAVAATKSLYLALALIALAAIGRALPYYLPELGNFTPVFAVALFAGALLRDRKLAMLVPLLAMLITDLIIGVHSQMWLVYGCMAITVFFGMRIQQRISTGTVLRSALAASVLFFVASNLLVWFEGALYPKTLLGLKDCFVAAVPFWRNELFGSLLWSALLFGLHVLVLRPAPRALTA